MPSEKRHIKSTYASATPATDGRYVVAWFGSQGLYAFDIDGTPRLAEGSRRARHGRLRFPEYEWGTASSPIIWKDLVIVQCDTQDDSFVMALGRRRPGKTVWKTDRKELPSWGTPTVVQPDARARRARDQRLELHPRLRSRHRQGAVAARRQLEDHRADADLRQGPDHRRQRPRARAADLRDQARRAAATSRRRRDAESSAHVAWTQDRPRLVHADAARLRGHPLRARQHRGVRRLRSDDRRRRSIASACQHGGSGFSASPVAADGRIYLSSEDGDIFVVAAAEPSSCWRRTRWASR